MNGCWLLTKPKGVSFLIMDCIFWSDYFNALFLYFDWVVGLTFMTQKTRLTSKVNFFQLIFRVKCDFFDWAKLWFRTAKPSTWYVNWGGVRQGNWLGRGLRPHPPPRTCLLFIGFWDGHVTSLDQSDCSKNFLIWSLLSSMKMTLNLFQIKISTKKPLKSEKNMSIQNKILTNDFVFLLKYN